jgi:flagellar biosynthesis GTPase FlhF
MPDSLKGISTTVSASLIKKAQALQEGGWLLYRTEAGESIRCKLLAKIPDTDQLLFVNRNGLKVLQMGIEDMAYCLSAGIARQLREGDFFNSAWQQCVRAVLNEFEQRQEELQERKARRVEEERLREEQRVQAELDRKQQELRRIAAAGKAKAEALAIAKAKAEAEREAAEQAEQERQERAQQQLEERDRQRVEARKIARLSLDSISIGAWVEIPNADGEATKSKLAVKISSTKKYIFVDRNGLKVAQLLRDELIEMLVEGQAKILDLGENFEDRLAKVVEGLRRDKS